MDYNRHKYFIPHVQQLVLHHISMHTDIEFFLEELLENDTLRHDIMTRKRIFLFNNTLIVHLDRRPR